VTTTGHQAIQTIAVWDEAFTDAVLRHRHPAGLRRRRLQRRHGDPRDHDGRQLPDRRHLPHRPQGLPAGDTSTSARVTALATSNAVAGTDSADTTLVVRNTAPTPGASWAPTPPRRPVSLNWTYATFGNYALVVRYTADTDTTMPVDGTTYTAGKPWDGRDGGLRRQRHQPHRRRRGQRDHVLLPDLRARRLLNFANPAPPRAGPSR
jgi:hypothetical protein